MGFVMFHRSRIRARPTTNAKRLGTQVRIANRVEHATLKTHQSAQRIVIALQTIQTIPKRHITPR
jgi:hypothetical protein